MFVFLPILVNALIIGYIKYVSLTSNHTIIVTRQSSDGGGNPSTDVVPDPGTPTAPAFPFIDVKEGDWFYEDVYYLFSPCTFFVDCGKINVAVPYLEMEDQTMPDQELSFEGFLLNVNPLYQDFVQQTHAYLFENGCKLKLQLAKNGYVVSYSHSKSKRVLLNFVFRKSGLVTRIYGDLVNQYMDFLETLPDAMIKSVAKAPVCRLCNDRCNKGYAFSIKGTDYQKCRYNCFMFTVDDENIPFIRSFLEHEIHERNA